MSEEIINENVDLFISTAKPVAKAEPKNEICCEFVYQCAWSWKRMDRHWSTTTRSWLFKIVKMDKPRIASYKHTWRAHHNTVFCAISSLLRERNCDSSKLDRMQLLFQTHTLICIDIVVCMKTREELYCRRYKSPRLPRVTLVPNSRHIQKDVRVSESRKSDDRKNEAHQHRETCGNDLCVDFRIPGIPHSAVEQIETNRKEKSSTINGAIWKSPKQEHVAEGLWETGRNTRLLRSQARSTNAPNNVSQSKWYLEKKPNFQRMVRAKRFWKDGTQMPTITSRSLTKVGQKRKSDITTHLPCKTIPVKLHLKKGDDGKGTGKLFLNKGVQGPTEVCSQCVIEMSLACFLVLRNKDVLSSLFLSKSCEILCGGLEIFSRSHRSSLLIIVGGQ